jgi:hypothetical protein
MIPKLAGYIELWLKVLKNNDKRPIHRGRASQQGKL